MVKVRVKQNKEEEKKGNEEGTGRRKDRKRKEEGEDGQSGTFTWEGLIMCLLLASISIYMLLICVLILCL